MNDQSGEFAIKNYFIPLTSVKAIHIIIILGLLVYFISFFNGFVGDDIGQTIDNPNIQSIQTIPYLFSQGTFNDQNGQSVNYYKPIVSVAYAMIYLFTKDNAFGFHLFQVLLHIINAICIFIIFSYFLKKGLALALSLVFLLHPINTETVVYISDLQEVLFVWTGCFMYNTTRCYI